MGNNVVWLDPNSDVSVSVVGNKAYALHRVAKMGVVKTPKSIVLGVHGTLGKEHEISNFIDVVNANYSFPVIVRSSGTLEDSDNSFAGQFVSLVCRDAKELYADIQSVISSANSENVVAYCKKFGIDHTSLKMAVIVQEYLSADESGVIFTRHPIFSDGDMYCESKLRSTDAVTSGDASVSGRNLPRCGFIENGFLKDLRDVSLAIEYEFGYSVDIEWILSNGDLWVLQVRKITA